MVFILILIIHLSWFLLFYIVSYWVKAMLHIFTSVFSIPGARWNNILGYDMNSCHLSFMRKTKKKPSTILGSSTAHKKRKVWLKKTSVLFYDNLPIQLMPAVFFSVITSEEWILVGSQCWFSSCVWGLSILWPLLLIFSETWTGLHYWLNQGLVLCVVKQK